MKRLPSLPSVVFVLSLAFPSVALADNITYLVEPYLFPGFNPNLYSIDGGFITTNGTLGELAVSDILDYEFVVSGPLPYTFRPTSPAASLSTHGVTATLSRVFLPIIDGPTRFEALFELSAADNSAWADCDNCTQLLKFRLVSGQGPLGFELGEGGTDFVYSAAESGPPPPSNDGAVYIDFIYQPHVLATIPEPSTALLLAAGLVFMRRRRL